MKCSNDKELIENLEAHRRVFEGVGKIYEDQGKEMGNLQFGISARNLKEFLKGNDLETEATMMNTYLAGGLASKESAEAIINLISQTIEKIRLR